MAITFGASAQTGSAAAGTMVVTLPTHSEDDLIVLAFTHDYDSDGQQLSSVNNGFTRLTEHSVSGGAFQTDIWYKVAGASETNPTATYALSTQEMSCLAFCFSGVDTTTPIDVSPPSWAYIDNPLDGLISSPNITTVTNGAMMVVIAGADDNDAFTQPSGMTLVSSYQYINMTVAAAYLEIATAGATGAKEWSFAQNGDELVANSFALNPADTSGNVTGSGALESPVAEIDGEGQVITASITISGISGGENLSSLSYAVFSEADIGSATLIKQGNDGSTDENGDLFIDLTGTGVLNGTVLTVLIDDYTTAPTGASKGAICYGTAAAL